MHCNAFLICKNCDAIKFLTYLFTHIALVTLHSIIKILTPKLLYSPTIEEMKRHKLYQLL